MRLVLAVFFYVLLIATYSSSTYAKSKVAEVSSINSRSAVNKAYQTPVSGAQSKRIITFPAEQIGNLYSLPTNWIEVRNYEKYFGPAKGSVSVPTGAMFLLKLSYYLVNHPDSLRLPDNVIAVSGDDIGFDDTICEALSKAPSLEWIDLRSAEITDEGVGRLAKMKNLRGLEVARTQVRGSCIKTLSTFKNLDYLDLSQNNLKSEYFPSFALLTHLNSARFISAGLVDHDLKWISCMKSLESLSLKGDLKLSDAGVAFLLPLKRLKFLSVEGTAVTPKGLEPLLRNMNLKTVMVSEKLFPRSERARLNKLYSKTKVTCLIKDLSDTSQLFEPLK